MSTAFAYRVCVGRGRCLHRPTRGVVIVFVALALPFILLLAAFAVDMAYLKLARRELENTADTTARAAMSEFARTGDVTVSRAAALNVASLNYVASEPMRMSAEDIEFGRATEGVDGLQFVPDEKSPNAVRVQARRTADSMAGPIKLFFARSFGKVNIEMVQSATARSSTSDVVLVLDRGRTMAFGAKESSKASNPAVGGKPWKWCSKLKKDARFLDAAAAIDLALQDYEAKGSTTRVALVTYGNKAVMDVDFTTDYAQIRSRLNAIAAAYCEETLEDMTGAINLAANVALSYQASAAGAGRNVYSLLISDDGQLIGDPVLAAASSLQNGVMVDVISYTPTAGSAIPNSVASAGGGKHDHADDQASLVKLVDAMMDMAQTVLTAVP